MLTSSNNIGEVTFMLDGRDYTFVVDAAHIPYIRKTSKYKPLTAFNFCKKENRHVLDNH